MQPAPPAGTPTGTRARRCLSQPTVPPALVRSCEDSSEAHAAAASPLDIVSPNSVAASGFTPGPASALDSPGGPPDRVAARRSPLVNRRQTEADPLSQVEGTLLEVLKSVAQVSRWKEPDICNVARLLVMSGIRTVAVLKAHVDTGTLIGKVLMSCGQQISVRTVVALRVATSVQTRSGQAALAASCVTDPDATAVDTDALLEHSTVTDWPSWEDASRIGRRASNSLFTPDAPEGAVELRRGTLSASVLPSLARSSTPPGRRCSMQDSAIMVSSMTWAALPRGTAADYRVIQLPLSQLYFYQSVIARSFSDGHSLQGTVDGLRSGSLTPEDLPLAHGLFTGRRMYFLGSRRLTCFNLAFRERDPGRLIPVLWCGAIAPGLPQGNDVTMSVLGGVIFDGRLLYEVTRDPASPDLDVQNLKKAFVGAPTPDSFAHSTGKDYYIPAAVRGRFKDKAVRSCARGS
eukprot:TRINITY_DN3355_c1_g2_i1.p1 TRINITY_DN3355_c1_g2~~TRINITY_DN3355_c1_g2_i1.p1  ORF type:complete len:461 (+),score=109.43 TRINITY_DN3355_c1_g2_i1:70-1452(+)